MPDTESLLQRLIEQVSLFLKGKGEDLLRDLRRQMRRAAEELQFEKAAAVRDRILAVETTLERQRVGSSAGKVDRDIFGMSVLDRHVYTAVLFVREGNVQDVASYRFPAGLDEPKAIFRSFLNQFYSANRFIPREVLIPVESEDAELLAQWLSEQKGRKVEVIHPQRGEKSRLVELANRNAAEGQRTALSAQEKRQQEMDSLRQILGLRQLPRNIECFDISTLYGREAVGSMVVFRDAELDKASYRHYRIKSEEARDDTAMMREVLSRRFERLVCQGEDPPQLVLLDGGKGQLGVALEVLDEAGLPRGECDAAALAKARSSGGQVVKAERVYLPGRRKAVDVPSDTSGFRLVTRIRDEAHRFAISYHRRLRRKAAVKSPLAEIPGVGDKLARRLTDHFGGLNKVREASEEELTAVKGISPRLARRIWQYLPDLLEDA